MGRPLRPLIGIIGGTGLIGRATAHALKANGWGVRIISRDPERASEELPGMEGYAKLDLEGLTGLAGIINLAGSPLFAVPTRKNKERMRKSRIETTRTLVKLIEQLDQKPSVLIQGSAVGFYGADRRNDRPQDEQSLPGRDFLAKLCEDWEAAAIPVQKYGVRLVIIRTGLILDPGKNGLLGAVLPFYKVFLGIYIGAWRGWKPWVHLDDEVGLILFALKTQAMFGPVNAVSPGIARNGRFYGTLGRVLKRPAWIPVPAPLLRLFFGDFGKALADGPKVVSTKAHSFGFVFRYKELEPTLEQIFE